MINLFCLPYAGGDANSFIEFNRLSDASIKVITLELPGRRVRFNEKLLESIDEMADDYIIQVQSYPDQPYALFGHSMGALIGYIVIRKIIETGKRSPVRFFASGFAGPSVAMTEARKKMPGKEELDEVMKGKMILPESFLNIFPLIYEPLIRTDLMAFKNYQHHPMPSFNIPITVFIGREDDITPEEARAWQHETTEPVSIITYKGKHHFWKDHACEIMSVIKASS